MLLVPNILHILENLILFGSLILIKKFDLFKFYIGFKIFPYVGIRKLSFLKENLNKGRTSSFLGGGAWNI
jgi:hypothetical protein